MTRIFWEHLPELILLSVLFTLVGGALTIFGYLWKSRKRSEDSIRRTQQTKGWQELQNRKVGIGKTAGDPRFGDHPQYDYAPMVDVPPPGGRAPVYRPKRPTTSQGDAEQEWDLFRIAYLKLCCRLPEQRILGPTMVVRFHNGDRADHNSIDLIPELIGDIYRVRCFVGAGVRGWWLEVGDDLKIRCNCVESGEPLMHPEHANV